LRNLRISLNQQSHPNSLSELYMANIGKKT
jgi:hypothetical protein